MTLTRDEAKALLAAALHPGEEGAGCDDVFLHFAARVDQELLGAGLGGESRRLAAHLEECPDCAEEYAALRAAIAGG